LNGCENVVPYPSLLRVGRAAEKLNGGPAIGLPPSFGPEVKDRTIHKGGTPDRLRCKTVEEKVPIVPIAPWRNQKF